MRYLPLTPADRAEMLRTIGAASVDDLFADVPDEARLDGPVAGLPAHASELAVERHMAALAARNWPVLAEAVLSAGVESDLGWYYLGVAAQGMGLNQPARTYFQASIRRSRDRSGMACGAAIPCDGVALPRAAQAALAAITPRPRAQPATAAEPAPAEDPGAQAPSNWVRPVAQ